MNEQRAQSHSASSEIDDLATDQGTPDQWRAWLRGTVAQGGRSLRAAGLVLLLGLTAAAVALLTLVFLTDVVLDKESQQLDQGVLGWLQQFSSPQMDLAARALSTFGSELVLVFSVALLGAFALQRRWGAATTLVLIVGGAQLLNDALKQLVHRTRPSPVGATLLGQAYSFPSGHTMMAIALYTFAAYLGWRLLDGWRRVLWVTLLALVVLLVGLSRLYLEVHYPTDVLAGYLAGFMWADTVLLSAHVVGRRRIHARPPPANAPANTGL